MLARRAGHGQHIVQRHGQVGQQDLEQRLAQGLRLGRVGGCAADLHPRRRLQRGFALGAFLAALGAQVAPHLPADPEQQDAAGHQQADDFQQLGGDQRKADQHHHGARQPHDNGAAALMRRQAGGGHADGHGVVAGQRQVDHHHLEKRGDRAGGQQVGELHRP